ncbi:MAG: hypothetical protein HRT99_02970 [Mycoplasmatales bacterium]|nr:hypothetical protein [Mycoplasmatales bacterium]
MNNFNSEINKEIHILEKLLLLDNKANSTDRNIANSLLSFWKKREPLPDITKLGEILNIGPPSISKFLKKYKMRSFPIIKYIFEINSNYHIYNSDENKVSENNDIIDAINKIKNARKIIIVGAGNSGVMGKMFYTRLVLQGWNAFFLDGEPDQIKLMNRAKENDLIICVSFSMSHQWTKWLWKKRVNSIFFTYQPITGDDKRLCFVTSSDKNIKYTQASAHTYSETLFILEEILHYLKKIKNEF